jgi:hypothetical protein
MHHDEAVVVATILMNIRRCELAIVSGRRDKAAALRR